jgi:hypothetical protein
MSETDQFWQYAREAMTRGPSAKRLLIAEVLRSDLYSAGVIQASFGIDLDQSSEAKLGR